MQLTKYEHACFAIEHEGMRLLVDPGNHTQDETFQMPTDIVYYSHEHDDHCFIDNLARLRAQNPELIIIGNSSVAAKLKDFSILTASPGNPITHGPFNFQFFGNRHAQVHPDIPRVDNLGILINKSVYYPGDSFEPCAASPNTLLLPITGNWMKIQEAIDLMLKLRPTRVIPTHDAPLSAIGQANALTWVRQFAGTIDCEVHTDQGPVAIP